MKEPNHPIFRNLSNPFFTLYTPTGLREDYKSWWNLDVPFETRPPADRFDGRYLASTEWDAQFKILCTVAEFGSKVKAVGDTTGRVICVGAGAYDWFLEGGTNTDRPQLETFTTNILNYIRPTRNLRTGTKDITELMSLSVYPNPANETVNFGYTLKQSGVVKIHIYDLQGREITQITEGGKTTGTHLARWNTAQTAAGIYVYRIESGNEAATGRITIMNK
jgi:Secretion system C-terminal sorting domain